MRSLLVPLHAVTVKSGLTYAFRAGTASLQSQSIDCVYVRVQRAHAIVGSRGWLAVGSLQKLQATN